LPQIPIHHLKLERSEKELEIKKERKKEFRNRIWNQPGCWIDTTAPRNEAGFHPVYLVQEETKQHPNFSGFALAVGFITLARIGFTSLPIFFGEPHDLSFLRSAEKKTFMCSLIIYVSSAFIKVSFSVCYAVSNNSIEKFGPGSD